MAVREDDVLVRDPSYVKYERLLHQAEAEGRIDGAFSCLVCGMRYPREGRGGSVLQLRQLRLIRGSLRDGDPAAWR